MKTKRQEAIDWFNSHFCKSECRHYETIISALTDNSATDAPDDAEVQDSLDALGRLSCASLANDSLLKEQIVKTELANFLRHTDVIHKSLFRAASKPDPEEVTVEWLVDMDYMEKYNAEQLALAKPNGIKILPPPPTKGDE